MGEANFYYFTCLNLASYSVYRRNIRVRQDADFREDVDGQDDHAGSGTQRQHRKRQSQDPGQRRHSSRSATSHLRRQTARGWTHALRLQHSKRVHASSGLETEGRNHRAFSSHVGPEIQLREDDLPKVLRASSSSRHQLPQTQLRTHQQLAPQEEAQVKNGTLNRLQRGIHSFASVSTDP